MIFYPACKAGFFTSVLGRRDFLRLVAGAATAVAVPPVFAQTQQAWPLWLRRGKDEHRFDAAQQDGYKAAMWLLRDVRAGAYGLPHPRLLYLASWAQSWLAAHSIHAVFDVTSGLRLPATNAAIEGAAQASLHLPTPDWYFFAFDFRARGLDAEYTAMLMRAVGMGGVGIYWKRDFVHADVGRRRDWSGS